MRRRTDPQYVVDENGCWIWQWSRSRKGYGVCMNPLRPGTVTNAHRVYYEREHGALAIGLVVDHLCRVRACVNPAHLEAVTQRENVRRGDGTKVTATDVVAIRADTRPHPIVAAERGLSVRSVQKIRAGLIWPDVPMPDPRVEYERAPWGSLRGLAA